jgi:hypothetical protein
MARPWLDVIPKGFTGSKYLNYYKELHGCSVLRWVLKDENPTTCYYTPLIPLLIEGISLFSPHWQRSRFFFVSFVENLVCFVVNLFSVAAEPR